MPSSDSVLAVNGVSAAIFGVGRLRGGGRGPSEEGKRGQQRGGSGGDAAAHAGTSLCSTS